MWRPESLGEVIAERVCDLKQGDRRVGRVTISFGRPVRAPGASSPDPWWCPVRICGTGIDLLRPIAGEDSLQALILGLEFAADILPQEANALRPGLDWLGQIDNAVVDRQSQSLDPENAFTALFRRLESAVAGRASVSFSSPRAKPSPLRAVGSTTERTPASRRTPARRKR
jgi:hypothetical protein